MWHHPTSNKQTNKKYPNHIPSTLKKYVPRKIYEKSTLQLEDRTEAAGRKYGRQAKRRRDVSIRWVLTHLFRTHNATQCIPVAGQQSEQEYRPSHPHPPPPLNTYNTADFLVAQCLANWASLGQGQTQQNYKPHYVPCSVSSEGCSANIFPLSTRDKTSVDRNSADLVPGVIDHFPKDTMWHVRAPTPTILDQTLRQHSGVLVRRSIK